MLQLSSTSQEVILSFSAQKTTDGRTTHRDISYRRFSLLSDRYMEQLRDLVRIMGMGRTSQYSNCTRQVFT